MPATSAFVVERSPWCYFLFLGLGDLTRQVNNNDLMNPGSWNPRNQSFPMEEQDALQGRWPLAGAKNNYLEGG